MTQTVCNELPFILSLQKHICGLLMTLKWMNQIDEKEKHLSEIGKGKINTHTKCL